MRSVAPPFFYRWLSPAFLTCSIPVTGKEIFLTFDDGPVPEVTPVILEILHRYSVPATFFCVGQNVQKNPGLFHEVTEAGHAVGNHTYHHLNGWRVPPGAYMDDVDRCAQLVQSNLFRPPYGKFTPAQYFLLRKSYRFILWAVLSYDFDRHTTPEECLQIVNRYTSPGSIVVFHDNIKSLEKVRYALPGFLEKFLRDGYVFKTL